MLQIKCIDHFVITTANSQTLTDFYKKLGFTDVVKTNETELSIGDFKIHVQTLGQELTPHAQNVMTGSVDICFHLEETIEEIQDKLKSCGLQIELGPVSRVGAKGDMKSVYLRDPDGNLIELSSYKNQ